MKHKYFLRLFVIFIFFYFNVNSFCVDIIPYPNSVDLGEKAFLIDNKTQIITLAQSYETALYLRDHLEQNLKVIKNNQSRGENVILFEEDTFLPEETYKLEVTKEKITIIASANKGWFYGVQSLLQLISKNEIPEVTIKDAPRFFWRAFMLDEARYFKGKEQVKLLLNEMARLKMNVFHWHLVDDEGWRIEIKKYPLLTQIGSKRKSTQLNYNGLKWKSPIQSGEEHRGFYTQKDIKEIVKYASDRHIKIVPEIEMPGHASAAVAAYPHLGTKKQKMEVPTFFSREDIYDVSTPEVYQFLTDVIDEVIELFPSEVIHVGGDEAMQNYWKESEKVLAYMSENKLKTTGELQTFFMNKMSQYLHSKGKRMMGWNEILGHNIHNYVDTTDVKSDIELAPQSVIHFWKGDLSLLEQAVQNKYDVVNSLHTLTYLDYDYGRIPLSKSYNFDPIPKGLDVEYHSKVIGLGCQMWGEWIPTSGEMQFMVFPRIAAYAEVGWTNLGNKDFNEFKKRLVKLKEYWKKKNIIFATDEEIELITKK